MALTRPGDGKAFPPGPYSHGGHSLVLGGDGGIKVKAGDTISGYSACLYRDLLKGWEEFGQPAGDGVAPLASPDLIQVGDTVYHIPTWNAGHPQDPYKQHALALIDAFAARRGPQAFTMMDRGRVAHGLRQRVLDPILVNQGGAAVCPSAALVYMEALHRPVHYVHFVTQLFEHGRSSIRGWRIEPSRRLLEYLPPIWSIDDADWIPMASIRESDEWFWSNRDIFSNGGVAHGGVIAQWLTRAGYTDVRDNSSKSRRKETERNLRLAGAYYEAGYTIVVLFDAMVLQAPAARRNEIWMHAVTLASPIAFALRPGGAWAVDFTVQTWGSKEKMIPSGEPCMLLTDFLNHYYGFVAARF